MSIVFNENRLVIRRHGYSMSSVDVESLKAARKGQKAAKRDRCGGWTYGCYKRLVERLQSVCEEHLFSTGFVHAITLTYGHAEGVPSAGMVKLHRERLLGWAARHGFTAVHWLVEFQRNGYPHMHLIAKHGVSAVMAASLVDKWLSITSASGARSAGQHVSEMSGFSQYALYLAKHASRQNWHYQRASLPTSWGGYSGRMWGFTGDWKFDDAFVIVLDIGEWWRVRRVIRRLARADLNRRRPVVSRFRSFREFKQAKRQWLRGVVFLRRQLKGLSTRLRKVEYDLSCQAGWLDPLYSHEAWCRSWSESAPINGWLPARIVSEAVGYG